MKSKISVTMITKDASKYITESLKALERFDEVILLDNGSDDDTVELAERFDNVSVYQSEFIGFGPLKNLAIGYARNSWILSVDSDEVLSKELVDEILSLELDSSKVYSILRDNYYNKKLMKCCGWEGDWVMRLFDKNRVLFNLNRVHESLELSDDISVEKLKHTMKHFTYQNAIELVTKMQRYSTLWAEDYRGKKSSSPTKATMRAIFAFVKFYIFKRGFLNGYEGLLISATNANGVFYKYIKLYEANRRG
ncbi:Putative two-domain glycosyltransferase [hydrothermal vent metagenome]|uniref:Putative two-domain glycosyltransferase n=1 Tax=hydrothermal vent metagenome TaxID=652676 RepID=A0A1W1BG61_9ZZZZ